MQKKFNSKVLFLLNVCTLVLTFACNIYLYFFASNFLNFILLISIVAFSFIMVTVIHSLDSIFAINKLLEKNKTYEVINFRLGCFNGLMVVLGFMIFTILLLICQNKGIDKDKGVIILIINSFVFVTFIYFTNNYEQYKLYKEQENLINNHQKK